MKTKLSEIPKPWELTIYARPDGDYNLTMTIQDNYQHQWVNGSIFEIMPFQSIGISIDELVETIQSNKSKP